MMEQFKILAIQKKENFQNKNLDAIQQNNNIIKNKSNRILGNNTSVSGPRLNPVYVYTAQLENSKILENRKT